MKYIVSVIVMLMITIASQSQGLYSLTYTMGFTSGETADYIKNPSFRGLTFEGRSFLTDEFSVGGLINWSTFFEELGGESFTIGTATLTGNQYRYINAFPVLFQAHYYLGTDEFEPRAYLGGGLGAYKMIQTTDMGIWELERNNWHFGMSPEVGLLHPLAGGSSLNVSFRYHYVFKADETIDFSWFGLSLGFAWGD